MKTAALEFFHPFGMRWLCHWLFAGFVLAASVPSAASELDIAVRRVPVLSNGGFVVLMQSGKVWFYVDGVTAQGSLVYSGLVRAENLVPAGGGVVAHLSDGRAFFSPDGLNLGGGGVTVPAYAGTQKVTRIASVNNGVVTLFSGGGAYFSPDGRNLGGGGSTTWAYRGKQKLVELVEVTGGIKTRFSGGGIYLSTTGLNLGGGGATYSTPTWNRVVAGAAFRPRDSAKTVSRDGAIAIVGGFFQSPNWSYADYWSSTDSGETWQLQAGSVDPAESPPVNLYEPYSPVLPLGSDLLAIGSSVWRSRDGMSWQKLTSGGPALATEDTFAFNFKGRIVVIQTHYGKVFTSEDGVSWSAGYVVPVLPTRCGAAVTMSKGRLWIMGGSSCDYLTPYNDIWSTEDGFNWQRATNSSDGALAVLPWGTRMWPATCSDGNTIWAIGGFRIQGDSRTNLGDIWYSPDGVNWRQLMPRGSTFGVGIEPRHAAACFVQPEKNRVLVVAGKGGVDINNDWSSVLNDVWALELPLMPSER